MRPGRTQTGINSDRYEIFATVYMKPGRNAWCLVSGQNDMSSLFFLDFLKSLFCTIKC